MPGGQRASPDAFRTSRANDLYNENQRNQRIFVSTSQPSLSLDMVGQNLLHQFNMKAKLTEVERLHRILLNPDSPLKHARRSAVSLMQIIAHEVQHSLVPKEHKHMTQRVIDLIRVNSQLSLVDAKAILIE